MHVILSINKKYMNMNNNKKYASSRPSGAEGNRIFHAHGKAGTPTGYTDDLRWWISKKKAPKVYRK